MVDNNKIIEEISKVSKDVAKNLRFGTSPDLEIEFLSTGIPVLDTVLGGGYRKGQQVLVYGEYSSGKTYLCQKAIASAQANGLSSVFVDVEKTFTPEWFEKSGVDVGSLVVSRPRTGEEAVDTVKALVRANVDLVVVDSLAALAPTQELEKDADENTMALQAKLAGRMFRAVLADSDKTVVLYTNQIRSSLNPYGSPETLPTGKAQHFYAWNKIKCRRGEWLSAADLGIEKAELSRFQDPAKMGFQMVFAVEKNKQNAPWQSVSVPFSFKDGLNLEAALIDIALEKEVIETRGAGFFYYGGEMIARGRPALLSFIKEHPELKEEILGSI